MRVILLSFVVWLGISCGNVIVPYSFNYWLHIGDNYPPPPYDYPYPSQEILKKLPAIETKHLNDSLRFGEMSVNLLKTLEENLRAAGIEIEKGSPEYGYFIESYPDDDAVNLQHLSSIITKTSAQLSYKHCGRFGVINEECAGYISKLKLKNTNIGDKCDLFHKTVCNSKKIDSKYRSFDGSCNNPNRGSLGRRLSGFKRLLHPEYADAIDKPRMSAFHKPLPSARMISSLVARDISSPDVNHTLMLMQWTQFVEHDLIHIPVRKMVHIDNSISCCDRNGNTLSPRHQHPSCFPISVEKNDPFFSPQWIRCLPYTRSITTFRSDCTFGAAEQMNQATHFLDGSQIYGSNAKIASSLRTKNNGLMEMLKTSHGSILPLVEQSKRMKMCQINDHDDICFKSGDTRVNMHPYLTAMHILWLKEHNRIARQLSKLNPSWNDEKVYQETRRIVIAQLQYITYNEWLPSVIGRDAYDKLSPYQLDYDPNIDVSVTNSLAVAGLRFFNSMLDGNINLLNEDRSINETILLMNHFNSPDITILSEKYSHLVRGAASQPGQSLDINMVDDVTEKLYSRKQQNIGLDVLSLDIQRGRDHGIPGYHQYRVMCGMKPLNNFDDMNDVIPVKIIQQLKEIYSSVQDVDLIVGALAEKPRDGSPLGPTFSCLLNEQMHRTRSGDRYFYSNVGQPEPLSHHQINQIEKSSLARIICDNVPEIDKIQKDVFSVISDDNPLVSCNGQSIKHVNLMAWRDPKPSILTRTNVGTWITA